MKRANPRLAIYTRNDISDSRGAMKIQPRRASANLTIRSIISTAALAAAVLSTASAKTTIDDGCFVPRYDDHCERWVSVYDNPNGHSAVFDDYFIGFEEARAQAISPKGNRVYVTGYSWDNSTQAQQWATVAIDSVTGERLWVARHGGRGITSYAYNIAVSAEGDRVYVVGQQYREQQPGQFFSDATTIAYDAATGQQLWQATYRVPAANASFAYVAVSPNGTKVYVAGTDTAGGDFGTSNVSRYVTIAYSAATGTQEWAATHDNPDEYDSVYSLVLDSSGAHVFVGGAGGIVSYDAITGHQLWDRSGLSFSLNIAPDGSRLFTLRPRTDDSGVIVSGFDLIAYAAATGAKIWSYPLPKVGDANPPIVLDPGGARLYIAIGRDASKPNDLFQNIDAATLAFTTDSGRLLWAAHYNDPRFVLNEQTVSGLAVSPDGNRLYLAARSTRVTPTERFTYDISTVAYDATDGSQKWVGRYAASAEDYDVPADPYPASNNIGVTPDGAKIILTGALNHHPFGRANDLYPRNREDYAVVAYDTATTSELRPLKVVSRKRHGSAGTFDVAGIECRSGGPDNRYQLVVTFPSPVTFRSARVTAGSGSVTSTNTHGNEVIVKLTGVSNAQTIKVTLLGTSDGVQTNDVTVELSLLIGDITTSGSVSSSGRFSDIGEVQRQIGQPVTNGNFRADVTTDGVFGDDDASLVQSQSGTVLP